MIASLRLLDWWTTKYVTILLLRMKISPADLLYQSSCNKSTRRIHSMHILFCQYGSWRALLAAGEVHEGTWWVYFPQSLARKFLKSEMNPTVYPCIASRHIFEWYVFENHSFAKLDFTILWKFLFKHVALVPDKRTGKSSFISGKFSIYIEWLPSQILKQLLSRNHHTYTKCCKIIVPSCWIKHQDNSVYHI